MIWLVIYQKASELVKKISRPFLTVWIENIIYERVMTSY